MTGKTLRRHKPGEARARMSSEVMRLKAEQRETAERVSLIALRLNAILYCQRREELQIAVRVFQNDLLLAGPVCLSCKKNRRIGKMLQCMECSKKGRRVLPSESELKEMIQKDLDGWVAAVQQREGTDGG